jgi:ketosteroid isomerase-like protein
LSKNLLLFFFIVLSSTAGAQKNIDGMVAAERAFAKYALDKNTKEAFLQFMDSAAVQFEEGKPVKSSAFWAKKEANTTRLKWWPRFAEIARSDDFGYTTGPWTFQKTDADTVAVRGQFTTVWQMNKNGEWKFLVDHGNDYAATNPAKEVQKIKARKKNKGTIQSMLHEQELFNRLAVINPQAAYQKYLSAQSILNFNGLLPITKTFEQLEVFNQITTGASFNIQGSGIASSGDMGYVFGASTFKEKTNNYLHVWRHEKNGWKIAVAVVYL